MPTETFIKKQNTKQTNLHLHKNVKKHLKCKMPAKSAGDSITNSSTMLPVSPAAATIIHNISFPCLDINREYLHLIWSFPAGLFFSGFKQFFKMLKCCIKKHKAKESTPGEPGLNLMYEWMNEYIPAQAVCERGGSWQVTFAINCASIPSRAEGPKRRGRARKVQTDVPERVYRCGNPTTGEKRRRRREFNYNV